LELVIASSFLPFFGYLAVTIGKQTICILYYGTRGGTIDPQLTSLAREENRRVSKVIVKDIDRTNAYASNFDGSIILTRKLVDVLSEDETKAILYHEISHISAYPAPVRVLAITFVFPSARQELIQRCEEIRGIVTRIHQRKGDYFMAEMVELDPNGEATFEKQMKWIQQNSPKIGGELNRVTKITKIDPVWGTKVDYYDPLLQALRFSTLRRVFRNPYELRQFEDDLDNGIVRLRAYLGALS
jgi:hypothetical protein